MHTTTTSSPPGLMSVWRRFYHKSSSAWRSSRSTSTKSLSTNESQNGLLSDEFEVPGLVSKQFWDETSAVFLQSCSFRLDDSNAFTTFAQQGASMLTHLLCIRIKAWLTGDYLSTKLWAKALTSTSLVVSSPSTASLCTSSPMTCHCSKARISWDTRNGISMVFPKSSGCSNSASSSPRVPLRRLGMMRTSTTAAMLSHQSFENT